MANRDPRAVGAKFDTSPREANDLGAVLRPAAQALVQAAGTMTGAAQRTGQAMSEAVNAGIAANEAHAALRSKIADGLGRMASWIGDRADAAASRQGALEGARAGLDPEFRTRGDGTIYGDAFDRAGLETYRSTLETTLAQGIADVEAKHGGDPGALAQGYAAFRDGFLKGVPQELQADVYTTIERRRLGAMREASRQQAGKIDKDQRAALSGEIDTRVKTVRDQAYRLGLDPAADTVLAEDLTRLKARLEVTGVDGQPIVPPEDADKLLRGTAGEVELARMKGAFDRLETIEQKRAFAEDLDSRVEAGEMTGSLTPEQYGAVSMAFMDEVNRLEAEAEHGVEMKLSDGLELLPDVEIEKRLDEIEPVGDEPAADMRNRIYGRLSEKVAVIRRLRLSDPASSVGSNPAVVQARQARVTGDPKSEQAYVATMIKAQAAAGITVPESLPRQEARQLFATVAYAAPAEVPQKLEALGRYVFRTYGELAPQVMLDIVRAGSGSEEVAKAAAPVMAMLASGAPPTAGSIARFNQATDVSAMDRAVLPRRGIGRAGMGPVPGTDSGQEAKPFRKRKAGFAAMHELIRNPHLAEDFDGEYGKGSAAYVLGLAADPWTEALQPRPQDPGLIIDEPDPIDAEGLND